jgi:peptide/nickel transport system permease protein
MFSSIPVSANNRGIRPAGPKDARPSRFASARTVLSLLYNDKLALIAALFLLVVVVTAIVGPPLVAHQSVALDLRSRNIPPFSLDRGWMFVLGSDALGRSMLARIIFASRITLLIACGAVVLSMVVGTVLGLIAGLRGGWIGNIILRLGDLVMSFPSLLLALVMIYILSPHPTNVIAVLALSRVPVYLRTVRAEVMEIRGRMFVLAARTLGSSQTRLILRHILPIVLPTLTTIATLDFAYMMLTEASLSFLGLGVQAPNVSWGLMVAEGRNYLVSAWWLSFWPGLAIMLTTLSLNLLSNWVRIAVDPLQRWRLESSVEAESEAQDG